MTQYRLTTAEGVVLDGRYGSFSRRMQEPDAHRVVD